MISREPQSVGLTPRLFLDCGADADDRCGALEISERGMCFDSPWRFDIGTQLSVLLQGSHPDSGAHDVALEGIVVWCERTAERRFQCTLLFLELPDELKPSLREFSHLATEA